MPGVLNEINLINIAICHIPYLESGHHFHINYHQQRGQTEGGHGRGLSEIVAPLTIALQIIAHISSHFFQSPCIIGYISDDRPSNDRTTDYHVSSPPPATLEPYQKDP